MFLGYLTQYCYILHIFDISYTVLVYVVNVESTVDISSTLPGHLHTTDPGTAISYTMQMTNVHEEITNVMLKLLMQITKPKMYGNHESISFFGYSFVT